MVRYRVIVGLAVRMITDSESEAIKEYKYYCERYNCSVWIEKFEVVKSNLRYKKSIGDV